MAPRRDGYFSAGHDGVPIGFYPSVERDTAPAAAFNWSRKFPRSGLNISLILIQNKA